MDGFKQSFKTMHLLIEQWQVGLSHTLHSIRSLRCTATNKIRHELFFKFYCSCLGLRTQTSLSLPRNVLMKIHVRTNKHKPSVDEVELIHATPNYAIVLLANGYEKTITLLGIAPVSAKQYYANDNFTSNCPTNNETETQEQPKENLPATPFLEDQLSNDN